MRETKRPNSGLRVSDEPGIFLLLLGFGVAFYGLVTSWLAVALTSIFTDAPALGLGEWVTKVLRFVFSAGAEPAVPEGSGRAFAICFFIVQMFAIPLLVFAKLGFQKLFNRTSTIENPDSAEIEDLTQKARLSSVRRLRPSISNQTDKQIMASPFDEVGFVFGQLKNQDLYQGLEDTMISIMGPRSGKTAALATRQVIGAAGPAVVTANKEDIWAITLTERARQTGQRCWTFDPQQITHTRPSWYWNPLRGVVSYSRASELATIFIPPNPKAGQNKFFDDAARTYLTALILAASLTPEPSMKTVRDWLNQPTNDDPIKALQARPDYAYLVERLASYIYSNDSNAKLNHSVIETARVGCACLNDPQILQWVTPGKDREEFDLQHFLTSQQTLYLLSKSEGAVTAGPIVAAFTNEIFLAANAMPDRLDPPLTMVLDEAANIVKIPALPKYYSFAGSKGILINTILQSYAQAEEVWGDEGARQMWGASALRLIGAGISDVKFADQISQLIGNHQVDFQSVSRGERNNISYSTQDKRIMEVSDIRTIKTFTAVLLANGIEPALINLIPWFETQHHNRITQDHQTMNKRIATQAQKVGIYGQHN